MKFAPIFLILSLLSCKKAEDVPTSPFPDLCGKTLVFIGDSMVADLYWNKSIGRWYAELTGQSVIYAGVGGETSTQVADRYEKEIECKTCPVFVSIGRNNNWESAQIKDDLRRIIGDKTEYFILEIVTSAYPNEEPGSAYYEHDQQLNAEIAAEWGASHIIQVTQPLQSLDPSDTASIKKGIAPAKYRRDELHLNELGNYEEAKILIARLMPCQNQLN